MEEERGRVEGLQQLAVFLLDDRLQLVNVADEEQLREAIGIIKDVFESL